jgi:hypothetical protein
MEIPATRLRDVFPGKIGPSGEKIAVEKPTPKGGIYRLTNCQNLRILPVSFAMCSNEVAPTVTCPIDEVGVGLMLARSRWEADREG